jgi:uncharacterized protein YjaG (DUF416 family)
MSNKSAMGIENISDLEKLDYSKQLVFAYLTCERLYPNYVYFSNNFHFGDKKILRSAIDFIANALLINNFSDDKKILRLMLIRHSLTISIRYWHLLL